MGHMCVKSLVKLSKEDLLYGEKTEFYEHCALGNQYEGVTFGDFAMLHPTKQIDENRDLNLGIQVECRTSILLGVQGCCSIPHSVR